MAESTHLQLASHSGFNEIAKIHKKNEELLAPMERLMDVRVKDVAIHPTGKLFLIALFNGKIKLLTEYFIEIATYSDQFCTVMRNQKFFF